MHYAAPYVNNVNIIIFSGVSLQDVESLDNFSISDVTLISMKDDKEISVDVDSSANECVIDQKEDDSSDSTETKKTFNYSLKINFHTNIFGKFKQTVVFDFGTRPLLSKVKNLLKKHYYVCF